VWDTRSWDRSHNHSRRHQHCELELVVAVDHKPDVHSRAGRHQVVAYHRVVAGLDHHNTVVDKGIHEEAWAVVVDHHILPVDGSPCEKAADDLPFALSDGDEYHHVVMEDHRAFPQTIPLVSRSDLLSNGNLQKLNLQGLQSRTCHANLMSSHDEQKNSLLEHHNEEENPPTVAKTKRQIFVTLD